MIKMLAAALAALMALSLSACSGDGENSGSTASDGSAVEVAALAKEMLDATSWNDEMIQISEDVVPNYYTIPDNVEEYVVYLCPTGATVEEISVFKTSDGKTADMESAIDNHIQARITEYESYRPEEVKKLNSATVVASDGYVAVIIADDNGPATDKFDETFGK